MSDQRKEYTVTIGGIPHRVLLDPDDAARAGAVEVKAVPTPKNKARTPRNKEG